MAVRDQEMRKKAAKSGIWDLKIDQINTENMKKILTAIRIFKKNVFH
ncbi:MAG: hypothetical protein Athens101426_388 [Parcubacteria group bacterium Athens1014_26]|nr:MAG: hypothetical protein Athens101426_388 [Parcubacteria group bacterium Athens1014_26]